MGSSKRVEGQKTLLFWLQVTGPGWMTDVYIEIELLQISKLDPGKLMNRRRWREREKE